MVFEIALRVRLTYKANDYEQASAEAFEKLVRYGQYSVVAVSFIVTLAIIIDDMCNLNKEKWESSYSFSAWAYSYLGMFFLMATVNIMLICVMRERKRRALLGNADLNYNFSRESCSLKILLLLFELSYLSRFLWDEFISNAIKDDDFAYETVFDACLYFDVLPFIGLLLFHYKNFRQSKHVFEEEFRDEELFGSMNEKEDVIYLEPTSSLGESKKHSLSSSSKETMNTLSLRLKSSASHKILKNTLYRSLLGPDQDEVRSFRS